METKNKSEDTPITLKWCDCDLHQIMLGVAGDECPYPMLDKNSDNAGKYLLQITDIFERIRGVLKPIYGFELENSAILSALICFDRSLLVESPEEETDPNLKKMRAKLRYVFAGVEDIPEKAKRRIEGTVRDKAYEWGLSDSRFDVQTEADIFGKYVVFCRRWLFNYEISITAQSLDYLNMDALELEWYVLHNDVTKCDEKMMALQHDANADANADARYRAYRYLTSSKAHIGAFETYKRNAK